MLDISELINEVIRDESRLKHLKNPSHEHEIQATIETNIDQRNVFKTLPQRDDDDAYAAKSIMPRQMMTTIGDRKQSRESLRDG